MTLEFLRIIRDCKGILKVLVGMSRHLSQGRENVGILREYLLEASFALSALRKKVRWKPGRDVQHLEKRKAMG